MRKIIVSDIHGSFYTLLFLLEKINFDKEKDQLICLGDMCDRGKNTNLVWNFFLNLQKENKQHVVLTGNHENMFLLALKEACYQPKNINLRINHYFRNSGLTTLKSFYPEANKENSRYYFKKFAKEHKDMRHWLKHLKFKHKDNDFYYVHAGINFSKEFYKQTKRDLIWIREPFLSSKESYDKKIIHGHTPQTKKPFREIHDNRINIDGGCVYGGKLNILVFENNNLEFFNSKILDEDK